MIVGNFTSGGDQRFEIVFLIGDSGEKWPARPANLQKVFRITTS